MYRDYPDDQDPRYDTAYHLATGVLCAALSVLGALACVFARRAGLSLEHAIGGLAVGLGVPLTLGHLSVAAVLLLRDWKQRWGHQRALAGQHSHRPHSVRKR
ncbi:MAG: hypothetical protein WKG00_35850 [Polyangiaceae bacterium]